MGPVITQRHHAQVLNNHQNKYNITRNQVWSSPMKTPTKKATEKKIYIKKKIERKVLSLSRHLLDPDSGWKPKWWGRRTGKKKKSIWQRAELNNWRRFSTDWEHNWHSFMFFFLVSAPVGLVICILRLWTVVNGIKGPRRKTVLPALPCRCISKPMASAHQVAALDRFSHFLSSLYNQNEKRRRSNSKTISDRYLGLRCLPMKSC